MTDNGSSETQRIGAIVERSVQGMTSEQLAWSPAGKWSTANILEHLSITYGGTARVLRKVIDNGAPLASRPTMYQRLATFVVTGLGVMPGGRQAPPMTVPTGLAPDAALSAIRRNLLDMESALADAAQRIPGNRKIADHPILGPLTLRQWQRFHWVHTLHHTKQIFGLRLSLGI
jgi:hypothetical protein